MNSPAAAGRAHPAIAQRRPALTGAQRRALRTLIARKRRQHPELAEPLTWANMARILKRERVTLLRGPMPCPAVLVEFCGAWAILAHNRRGYKSDVFYAAHELAHFWLHGTEADAGAARDRSTEAEENEVAVILTRKRDRA